MDTIILHSFNGAPREKATREAVNIIKGSYMVIDTRVSWEHVPKSMWETKADLIIMEHDVVPTLEMIDNISKCNEILCTEAYALNKGTTGLEKPVMSHRYIDWTKLQVL